MSKVQVKLNQKGLFELMQSDAIVETLQQQADAVVERCPKGKYETSKWIGIHRANVSIFTTDKVTFFRNLHTNELLKALGGKQ